MESQSKTNVIFGFSVVALIVLAVLVLFGIAWGYQNFKVYAKRQTGRALLAEAEFSKQVQLEEAKANLESQKLNSMAEVERAKGAAEAIKIEGGGLTENYIRYLWVQQQNNLNNKTVIYIPTEAGLPILEAGQR